MNKDPLWRIRIRIIWRGFTGRNAGRHRWSSGKDASEIPCVWSEKSQRLSVVKTVLWLRHSKRWQSCDEDAVEPWPCEVHWSGFSLSLVIVWNESAWNSDEYFCVQIMLNKEMVERDRERLKTLLARVAQQKAQCRIWLRRQRSQNDLCPPLVQAWGWQGSHSEESHLQTVGR